MRRSLSSLPSHILYARPAATAYLPIHAQLCQRQEWPRSAPLTRLSQVPLSAQPGSNGRRSSSIVEATSLPGVSLGSAGPSQLPRSWLSAHRLHRHGWRAQTRSFRTSPPRRDILFVTVPAFKSFLLSVTRITLVVLPFWWRWKLFRRFPKAGRMLWQIPVIAVFLVIAIGLDQSPGTARWRLLLMSEKEEMAWSQKRFEDVLEAEAKLILPASDKRVETLKRVCDRLVTAMEGSELVSAAAWPRDDADILERIQRFESRTLIRPSARTDSAFLPFKPESSNPQKIIEGREWDLFVVEMPKVNAFVLPTKEIFVYSGLIDLLEQEEPLIAAVMAHEIVHVAERHAVENMGFLALSNVMFDILRGVTFAVTVSFPFVTDAMNSVFNAMSETVAGRAYSRKLETEADTLGLMLMARAGYNPESALELWGLLNMLEREADQSNHSMNAERALPFLRTHPQGDVRLANIEKHLPAAMKVYRETLEPTKAQKLNTSLVHAKGKEDAEKEVRSNQGQMSGRQYKQLSTDVKPDARA